ncbi:4-hydroxy-tetrahydrodipicolinate synthase [Maribacter litopenaei]|uniref:4-hydroxy-tetrahydrodipicolinate synthase n=1 Tax=Maribacter litopenaei TaxID=2976127 RepID=A0ABY5YBD8_9FLAO|nr:4-hydroxy-tetrahydrodipicolinate synthase [Maribacter litopenaei]UWX56377.1 4-hydroxy-tetrahydrodipicolinate synthase [Maribacter litopenaei]
MEKLKGTGVALITPFTADGLVDVEALAEIVSFNIDGGVDYLVALGTTAESVTLTKSEKQLVVDTIVEANEGRLPLVIGIGGNNTMAIVEELHTMNLSQFDAILSVSPYYNRPTQEGIYQHFKVISEASPLPIILYNVPGRTGSNMLPSTTLRLARDFENIVAIKEACGNMIQVMELIDHRPKGFPVLSGDDITALPTILAGGEGVISVIGQGLPSAFSQMVGLGMDGKNEEAYELHYLLQEGMGLIFEEGNPAGIKAIFEILGMCRASVRLPLLEATPGLKNKIANFIASLTKIPA